MLRVCFEISFLLRSLPSRKPDKENIAKNYNGFFGNIAHEKCFIGLL
jgi:hypothetical protein